MFYGDLIGPLAVIHSEPRQARKGATVGVNACAGVWLVRAPPISASHYPFDSRKRPVAYQVFARKWRPKSFSSIKGQTHVTRALTNALLRGKLHHAYLFAGTRGVGKTTLARILAKCLNCLKGVTPEPCGSCAACLEIDQGCFPDLIEVDAASRTRVEDTRELLDNVQYAPTQGRFKIYLIDEVHMLSGHSFNALLKTLEEPPAHVKFILATTDPERLPATVLSRCLRFTLRALSNEEIQSQLSEILLDEKVTFEPGALFEIARAGAGSMRDALSLLEQAMAYCDNTLETAAVENMLGLSYQSQVPALLSAIAHNNAQACFETVEQMARSGADFSHVLGVVLEKLHLIALAQAVPSALGSELALDTVAALKTQFTPEAVQLLYQIALIGQRDLRFAPSARTGFEMTLLRMIAFYPVSQERMPVAPAATPNIAAPAAPIVAPVPRVAAPIAAPVAPIAVPAAAPLLPIAPVEASAINWSEVVAALPLVGLTKVLVQHCVIKHLEGESLTLVLDPQQKMCLNPQREAQIEAALRAYWGRAIKLSIVFGENMGMTPMQQAQEILQEKQRQTQDAMAQDKTLQGIIDAFGATVEKVTRIE